MTERRRGLGRGLGALIPTAHQAVDRSDAPAERSAPEAAETSASAPWLRAPQHALALVGPSDTAHSAAPSAHGETGPEPSEAAHERSDTEPVRAEPSHNELSYVELSHADGPRLADEPMPDDASLAEVGARYAELDVDAIRPNPKQPRSVFDEDALAELVHSIREIGVLQPVVVRELSAGSNAGYELVMGERRWRAAREAGLATVPAIIRDTPDDALLRDALLENLHRAQLNALEEAAAYDQLLRDFGCTQEQLADRIGRSRPQISNTLRLLKLPPSVQRRLAAGVLSAGHARALLGLGEAAAQERLAQRIVAEGLSVRSVEEIVSVGPADGSASRTGASRVRRPVTAETTEVEERLSDWLDTRVRVERGRLKGKIVIEFASSADLDRLVTVMTTAASGSGPSVDPV